MKCLFFPGPENKDIFKQVMLDVLKSSKQRFRNKHKSAGAQSTPNLESQEIKEINKKIKELTDLIASKESSADESQDADNSSDADDETF